ncbi:hypothetical protein HPB52_013856 [Rhipicephalus sanguineus]|uniref:Uncharacterized protein n=1 Tax=Rhipicephalus sanguineus TaxID=34632 RepID=A0A9D4PME8_RHISA|nr:hypothetical protein HPB52_013856 [Rhipicephalus sanguineus]
MRTKAIEKRAASSSSGGNYYFSSWSYEDRAFLRALYKKFPCTKVHLMVQIMKSAPAAGRWDCSHWPSWANMARQVRSSIRKQVTPKEMEAFFWDVIAEGTGQDEVTERLDALIFGDDASSPVILAGETSSSAFDDKSTATEEESSEDVYEESDDDEVTVDDDDDDTDFTVRRSRSARVASKGSKRAQKRARSAEDQPRPGELALASGSAKMGEPMDGFGVDVPVVQAPDSAGNAKTVELSTGPDFEVALVLESVLSEVCKMDDARRQAFGQHAGGGAGEEYAETGACVPRIARCSAQSCITDHGTGQALDRDRPPSVCDSANGTADVAMTDSELTRILDEASHDNGDLSSFCVGDDGLVDGFTRSDFAGGDVSHDYAMELPEVEVIVHETANSFDKEVQCKPTCEDKAVQCDIDSSRIADMMHKEHLLRMEVMRYHKDVLMKNLGLP